MRDASVITSLTKISLRSVSCVPSHVARPRTVRRVVVTAPPGRQRDRLVVRQIDELVLGEAGMQRDVHQARQALPCHHRHAADRSGIEHTVAHDAKASSALGDQDRAIRQEGHRPRVRQTLRHDDAEVPLLGRLDQKGTVRHRRRGPDDRWRDCLCRARRCLPASASCLLRASGGHHGHDDRRRDERASPPMTANVHHTLPGPNSVETAQYSWLSGAKWGSGRVRRGSMAGSRTQFVSPQYIERMNDAERRTVPTTQGRRVYPTTDLEASTP